MLLREPKLNSGWSTHLLSAPTSLLLLPLAHGVDPALPLAADELQSVFCLCVCVSPCMRECVRARPCTRVCLCFCSSYTQECM